MKFLLVCAAFVSLSVSAATVRINSNVDSPIPGTEKLTHIPQKLLGTLIDAGIALKPAGKDKFVLTVNNFHCDYYSRAAYDGALAGIDTYSCRINSEAVLGTKKGKVISDGRAIVNILNEVEDTNGAYFTDCAMGKCTIDAKKIVCNVDNSIEVFSAGRFSCAITDIQSE